MNTTVNTTVNPVEIATAIAELSSQLGAANTAYSDAVDQVHYCLGERPTYRRGSRRKHWATDGPTAIAAITAAIDANAVVFHLRESATRALARIADAKATIARLCPELDRLDAIYREHRWTRFVTVADGHIHSGTVCAGGTIRPTTQITWNPDLSGLTEADAVGKLGPTLCSHCFPSAPVEWTRGEDKPADPAICTSVELTPAQLQAWNPRRVSSTRPMRVRRHPVGDPDRQEAQAQARRPQARQLTATATRAPTRNAPGARVAVGRPAAAGPCGRRCCATANQGVLYNSTPRNKGTA